MNELTHHGILGQKWGIRRYQNKDGSLTSLGKKHKEAALDSVNRKHRYDKAASEESKSDYNYVKKAGGNAFELSEIGSEYLNNKRSEISSRLYKNAIESNMLKVGSDYVNGKLTKSGNEKLNKIWSKEHVESILNKEDKKMIEDIRRHKNQISKDIESLNKIKNKDLRDLAISEYYDNGDSVKFLLDLYN